MSALVLGAVAYDAKVVPIWEGFRQLLRRRGTDVDYVLYSHYERQVDDLVAGRIDLAWHSPLAWVRTRRILAARGLPVRSLFMRNTDQNLRTAIVTRADSGLTSLADLAGLRVGVGALDSPQATLLPLSLLRGAGVDAEVVRFDVGVGLHGDHIGGEREAAVALREKRVDAACLVDTNLLLFSREGTLPGGSVRVVAHTEPFDHCVMTGSPDADQGALDALSAEFLAMSYAEPEVRVLLDLEGLTEWVPGRTDGFALLERAVDESGFYDAEGRVRAAEYRP